MRVGHYLRVAWLLTELGENSVFPRERGCRTLETFRDNYFLRFSELYAKS